MEIGVKDMDGNMDGEMEENTDGDMDGNTDGNIEENTDGDMGGEQMVDGDMNCKMAT